MRPLRFFLVFFVLPLSLTACGEPQGARTATTEAPDTTAARRPRPAWVERGNWVPEWSSYVSKEVTVDGKRITTNSPAAGARQHVRDADAPSVVDSGIRVGAKIAMSPVALGAGPLELRVGEVVERNVPLDQLEAIGTIGDSARVYWTWRRRAVRTENGPPVEVPFSTVFIEGIRPGRTEVSLHWPDSVRQSLVVTVSEPSAPR